MIHRAAWCCDAAAEQGFNSKKPKGYKPRLFRVQIKDVQNGRRCAVTREIGLSADNLNVTDSFLLDEGMHITLWHGRNTPPREKILVCVGEPV